MQALYDGDLTLIPPPPDRLSGLNHVLVGSWLYPPPRWYGELGVTPSLKHTAITPRKLPPRLPSAVCPAAGAAANMILGGYKARVTKKQLFDHRGFVTNTFMGKWKYFAFSWLMFLVVVWVLVLILSIFKFSWKIVFLLSSFYTFLSCIINLRTFYWPNIQFFPLELFHEKYTLSKTSQDVWLGIGWGHPRCFDS